MSLFVGIDLVSSYILILVSVVTLCLGLVIDDIVMFILIWTNTIVDDFTFTARA